MDVLFERCCGLDVHKKLVLACVIITPPTGEPERIVHSFGTMTDDLRDASHGSPSHRVS